MNRFVQESKAITKVLSANDTGETGGHQAGMLIPKAYEILSFFPDLASGTKNPRVTLRFLDSFAETWKFNFIYYNNRLFNGTRNEYRLTGMTSFIRQNNLKVGDKITLIRNSQDEMNIEFIRSDNTQQTDDDILILGTSWKVITI